MRIRDERFLSNRPKEAYSPITYPKLVYENRIPSWDGAKHTWKSNPKLGRGKALVKNEIWESDGAKHSWKTKSENRTAQSTREKWNPRVGQRKTLVKNEIRESDGAKHSWKMKSESRTAQSTREKSNPKLGLGRTPILFNIWAVAEDTVFYS